MTEKKEETKQEAEITKEVKEETPAPAEEIVESTPKSVETKAEETENKKAEDVPKIKEPEKTPEVKEKPKEIIEEKKEKKSDDDDESGKQTLLVETEKYLNTGAHIGTKFKSGDMKRYIYKVRKDGLNVLDVQTLDERLKIAAKFLAGYDKEKIVVVSRKLYGQTPAKVFAETIGAIIITGRFVPGTFTNPQGNRFIEPKVVLITEPETDTQAIDEATRIRIPVVAMASTNNSLRNVDLAIPINNKGRKSLALGYWILAKEILKERGDIKSDSEFTKTTEDFEYKMKDSDEKKSFEKKGRWDRKPRFPRRR